MVGGWRWRGFREGAHFPHRVLGRLRLNHTIISTYSSVFCKRFLIRVTGGQKNFAASITCLRVIRHDYIGVAVSEGPRSQSQTVHTHTVTHHANPPQLSWLVVQAYKGPFQTPWNGLLPSDVKSQGRIRSNLAFQQKLLIFPCELAVLPSRLRESSPGQRLVPRYASRETWSGQIRLSECKESNGRVDSKGIPNTRS